MKKTYPPPKKNQPILILKPKPTTTKTKHETKTTNSFEHRLRNHERIGPFADAVGMEGQHWNGRQFLRRSKNEGIGIPPNKLKRWRCRSIIKYPGLIHVNPCFLCLGWLHSIELTVWPLKIGLCQRKIVFQPSLFRCCIYMLLEGASYLCFTIFTIQNRIPAKRENITKKRPSDRLTVWHGKKDGQLSRYTTDV